MRRVVALALALAFAGDAMLGAEFVALPLRAHQLGADKLQLGVVGGGSYLLYSFLPLFSGRIGDALGRRFPLLLFLLSYPLVLLAYAFLPSLTEVTGVRVMEGACWALLWPSLEAIVVIEGGSGALKSYNVVWGAGALLGPVLGGFLILVLGLRDTFLLLSAVPLCFIPFVLLFVERLPRMKGSHADRHERIGILSLLVAFSFGFALTGFLSYFPVTASRAGFSPGTLGLLESDLSLWRFLAFALLGTFFGSKLGRGAFLALIPSGFLAITLVAAGPALWPLVVSILGAWSGLAYSAAISKLFDGATLHGRRAGAFESAIGLGSLLGPVSMGLLSSLFTGGYAPYLAALLPGVIVSILGALSLRGNLSVSLRFHPS